MLLLLLLLNWLYASFLQDSATHRPADQAAYFDSPPGFPRTVGKGSRRDQSNSPDDVLASNFSRKLQVDDADPGKQVAALW